MFNATIRKGIIVGILATLGFVFGSDTVAAILQVFALNAPAM